MYYFLNTNSKTPSSFCSSTILAPQRHTRRNPVLWRQLGPIHTRWRQHLGLCIFDDVSICPCNALGPTSVFGPSDAHGLMTSVFGPSDRCTRSDDVSIWLQIHMLSQDNKSGYIQYVHIIVGDFTDIWPDKARFLASLHKVSILHHFKKKFSFHKPFLAVST